MKLKKRKNSFLSLALTLCMLVSLIPGLTVSANAEGATPTVNASEKGIYGNGVPLLITAGATAGNTTVYIDTDGDGAVGATEKTLKGAGIANAPEDNSNLSNYSIFGGSYYSDFTGDTKITMTGGKVNYIVGGGYAEDAADKSAKVIGNTQIKVTGGVVINWVIGAGQPAGDGNGNADITGNVSITVEGAHGTAATAADGTQTYIGYLGSSTHNKSKVLGNSVINLKGGTMDRVRPKDSSGNGGVVGTLTVNVSGNPKIAINTYFDWGALKIVGELTGDAGDIRFYDARPAGTIAATADNAAYAVAEKFELVDYSGAISKNNVLIKDGANIKVKTLTYTVAYNGTGADSGSVAAQTTNVGSSTTVSANGFTKANSTFTGWNTAQDGKGTAYAAGASLPSQAANTTVTLYAQWVSAPVIGNVPAQSAVNTGTDLNATLTKPTVTANGYTINSQGWQTSADGSTGWTTVSSGSTCTAGVNGHYLRYFVTYTDGTSKTVYSPNSVQLTVNRYTPTLTLSAAPASPQYAGTKITLTAALTNGFASKMSDQSYLDTVPVTFKDGATTLGTAKIAAGTGIATFETTALTAGIHTLTAQFPGDANYNANANSAEVKYTTTAVTVPDAPTDVTATAGDGQATVSFTAPTNNGGGAITGYTVTASPGGKTATGAASPITVSGLTNGTAYTFTVTATNSAGTGAASAASGSVTPISISYMPSKTIDVTETSSDLFRGSSGQIKAEANMNSAFSNSVEVKVTDTAENNSGFGLGAGSAVYPFDISLYIKGTTTKTEPKDGYAVTISLPVPDKLLEVRDQLSIVHKSDSGTVTTLNSQLKQINGVWYLVFEAKEFSPYALVVSSAGTYDETSGLPYYLDSAGKEVFIGFAANGKYLAPSGAAVLFKKNAKSFTDTGSHWAKDYIGFVTERELFNGTGSNVFSPDSGMTRAMFATVIGRLYERSYGEIEALSNHAFTDCNYSGYYGKYVDWAAKEGIITGVGGGLFEPDREITREQMAAILYRFADFLGVLPSKTDTALTYPDAGTVSGWAQSAALYCQTTGIITGRDGGNFVPKGTATRSEVAAIVQRFIKTILV